MFIMQPSILIKKTDTVVGKLRALQQLPDLDPARATAAAVAFPALLNLKHEVVQGRWRQLLEVGERGSDVC
jgi:hypothetical protein